MPGMGGGLSSFYSPKDEGRGGNLSEIYFASMFVKLSYIAETFFHFRNRVPNSSLRNSWEFGGRAW